MGIFPILLGAAVSAGGLWLPLSFATAASLLLVALLRMPRGAALARPGWLIVEVPVLFLLLSTLVFRIRGSEDILADPLDPAGLFRIGCLGLAALLGMLAWSSPPSVTALPRVASPRPIRLYTVYVVIAFAGVLASRARLLTLFHAGEIAVALLVLFSAGRAYGPAAYKRILSVVYWFQVTLIAVVWLEVYLLPGQAVTRVNSPLPLQVEGVFPSIDHNGVGTLGAIMFVWSLGRFLTPDVEGQPRGKLALLLSFVGLVTLLAAQYRTGYIAAALALLLVLVFRYRKILLIVLGSVALVLASSAANRAEPFLLRGESPEQASELSSRVDWWKLAIPVWKESPLIGGGLLTATRLEVLTPIGQESTSTIHSTWVEALVGTGVTGLLMLAVAFLVLLWRAFRRAQAGEIVPLLLLTIIGVRSLTGTTFEASGRSLLIFLALAFLVSDRGRRVPVLLTYRRPSW